MISQNVHFAGWERPRERTWNWHSLRRIADKKKPDRDYKTVSYVILALASRPLSRKIF
jgi:hypothetical protein